MDIYDRINHIFRKLGTQGKIYYLYRYVLRLNISVLKNINIIYLYSNILKEVEAEQNLEFKIISLKNLILTMPINYLQRIDFLNVYKQILVDITWQQNKQKYICLLRPLILPKYRHKLPLKC